MYLSLQGNAGLGKAIEYFTSHGMPVSIPLNDTQKYDIVVDMGGRLARVQVKTSRNKQKSGSYEVLLKHCGVSGGRNIVTRFDKQGSDYLFIYTGDGKTYLIPTESIAGTSAICVGTKYSEYEVQSRSLTAFA